MPSLHPPFAAFPVALLTVVVLLELSTFFWRSEKRDAVIATNLVLALVFTSVAFFSGYYARDALNVVTPEIDKKISDHHQSGRLLLFALFPCVMLYFAALKATHGRKAFRVVYLISLMICFALLYNTGLAGGELVFQHGVGVRF